MKKFILILLLSLVSGMASLRKYSTKAIASRTNQVLAKEVYATPKNSKGGKGNDVVVTKGDASMFATDEIRSIASRQADAVKLLADVKEVLSDPDSSNHAKVKAWSNFGLVEKFLHCSASSLMECNKSLAPMAGTGKYHQSKESEIRQYAEDKAKKLKKPHSLETEIIRLREYTASKKESSTKKNTSAKAITPENSRPKRTKTATSNQPEPTKDKAYPIDKLPKPENGEFYTKPETVMYISNILVATANTYSRSRIIQAMISAGYIPAAEKTVERLHNKYKNDEAIVDSAWAIGRPRLVTKAAVKAKAAEINTYGNQGKDLESTVKDMIMEDVAKQKEEAGFIPIVKEPDIGTVNKYMCEMVYDGGVSLVQKATSKPETRCTSEKSERCSASNTAVIGYAHFEVMEDEDHELTKELARASYETRALFELVRMARGYAPIWVIRPELVFSTDDTTTYIFEGTINKKGKWVAASSSAVKNRGTSSVYVEEDSNMMNGMRVKNTFTFSGGGKNAPIFVTVSGLSEEEMPDDDFIHLKIPGLGINGKGVTVGQDMPTGHVFFMKKGKGADEQRVKTYQEEVLMKHINDVRKDIDRDFSYIPGNVPTKMKAVSWMDGDLAQVASVVDNVDEFAKMGVTVCKQNAARTGVEQPADLAPVFKLFKKYVGELTAKADPATKRFRDELAKAFNSEELSGLNLSRNNKNALLDFLAILSLAATKACTVENIMKGFYESGLVDEDGDHRFPVFHRILAQCKKEIRRDVVDQLAEDYTSLLNVVDKEGRVPESWFNDRGYPMDVNSKGDEVSRPDSITREHMQRSKVMTHPHQGQLRLENIQAKVAARRATLARGNDSYNRKLEAVNNAVTKLCKLAGKDVSESNLIHCTRDHFRQITGKGSRGKGLNRDDLIAFVCSRDPELKLKQKKDVTRLDRSMLEERAFIHRGKPNLLLREGPPNDLAKYDEETSLTTNARIPRRVNRVVSLFDQSRDVTASILLNNSGWVERLYKLFDMDNFASLPRFDQIGDDTKQKADTLTILLRVRLSNHINSRIENESTRTSHIWEWASTNLPVCAAYMILAGHITSNFQTVPEGGSLLYADSINFIPHERFKQRHGVYLQRDRKRAAIVRSGKKTSYGDAVDGFGKRIEEHEKQCKANKPSSNFYSLYPSNSTARSKTDAIQGVYEDLDHVIAAGYEPKGNAAQIVNRNWNDGGIMVLNQDEMRKVASSMPNKQYSDIEKFQLLMSYLFELAYDVAIEPSLNVSQSPGFESLYTCM